MNSYPTHTTLAGSQFHCTSQLISRYDAEQQWEKTRGEMRAEIQRLPTSSFARTIFDEDDLFYATFPDARRHAIDVWIAENGYYVAPDPLNGYFAPIVDLTAQLRHAYHAPTVTYHAESMMPRHYVAPGPMDAQISSIEYPTASLRHTYHAPPSTYHAAGDMANSDSLEAFSSSLSLHCNSTADSWQPSMSASVSQRNSVGRGQGSATQDVYHFTDHHGVQSFHNPSPPPSPEIIHLAPHLLVPSQRRDAIQPLPLKSSTHVHHTDFASPPPDTDIMEFNAPFSPVSACSTDCPQFPASSSFGPPQFTGDWEADALAAETLLYAPRPSYPTPTKPLVVPSLPPRKTPVIKAPPARRVRLTYSEHRARSQPYRPRKSRSRSDSPGTSSQPRKRAVPARHRYGKIIMACLFCRNRKIACGQPPPCSNSTTCNQCEQRNLECTYPSENRRGLRKAKKENDDDKVDRLKIRVKASTVKVKTEVTEDISMLFEDSDDSSSEWDGDV